jgi:hypothetical protein
MCKKNHLPVFLCFLWSISASSSQIVLEQKSIDDPQDAWIKPQIRIVNNDKAPLDLSTLVLQYFFFEEGVKIDQLSGEIWYLSTGKPTDAQIAFTHLIPSSTQGEKKANVCCEITFLKNMSVPPNSGAVLSLVINQKSMTPFNEKMHWSYIRSTTYTPSVNMAMLDKTSRALLAGNQPPTQGAYSCGAKIAGKGTVTLDPAGGAYDRDQKVKALAVADDGWHFDHWEGDVRGRSNPATVIVDAPKIITAVFKTARWKGADNNGGGPTVDGMQTVQRAH